MQCAMARGGHCRVGFENNMLMPDGSRAPNNEALVKVVANHARAMKLPLATAAQARIMPGLD